MIIDDKHAARITAQGLRGRNHGAQRFLRYIFQAQLYQAHPKRQQPFEPIRMVKNRVKSVKCHSRKAFPITGVDGAAMSRAGIGSA